MKRSFDNSFGEQCHYPFFALSLPSILEIDGVVLDYKKLSLPFSVASQGGILAKDRGASQSRSNERLSSTCDAAHGYSRGQIHLHDRTADRNSFGLPAFLLHSFAFVSILALRSAKVAVIIWCTVLAKKTFPASSMCTDYWHELTS